MEKSYTESLTLRACDCDIHGEWRPGAILLALQEIAGVNCAHLGIGREVTDAMGIAWVLSRTEVTLRRVPRLFDTVSVETWPLPTKHLFYPRVNAIRDAGGEQIGTVTALWALLDVNARRIVNSDVVLAHLPDNRDMPGGMPAMARPLNAEPAVAELTPAYTDFDVNGHVNNTKYLDWLCNALGHEALARQRVVSFAVSYDQEVLPGTRLRTELTRQDDRFAFCGFAGEKRCFCVSGRLEDR